jgi:hypothetical protein
MRRFLPILAVAALMTVSLLRPARAQVLFDNFGPGNAYKSGTGWTLGVASPPFIQGEAFTPGLSAPLASIEAAINLVSGPNELTLKLMTDDGGKPGSVIEEWAVSGAMGLFGDSFPTVTVTSALNPLLSAGTQYWVVPFVSSDTWAAWNWNSVGDTGPHATSTDGGASYSVGDDTRGAFRVLGGEVPEVPEPGTLALLIGAGSAGSLFLIRRRKR